MARSCCAMAARSRSRSRSRVDEIVDLTTDFEISDRVRMELPDGYTHPDGEIVKHVLGTVRCVFNYELVGIDWDVIDYSETYTSPGSEKTINYSEEPSHIVKRQGYFSWPVEKHWLLRHWEGRLVPVSELTKL